MKKRWLSAISVSASAGTARAGELSPRLVGAVPGVDHDLTQFGWGDVGAPLIDITAPDDPFSATGGPCCSAFGGKAAVSGADQQTGAVPNVEYGAGKLHAGRALFGHAQPEPPIPIPRARRRSSPYSQTFTPEAEGRISVVAQ